MTLFGRSGRILSREDDDAVAIAMQSLKDDGVDMKLTFNVSNI